MTGRKRKGESRDATLANIKDEMTKPRMAKSARTAERSSEQPSITLAGTVNKIIPSAPPRRIEKAEIAVDGADRGHRDLRIENTLTDEHGDDVKLKKGVHVSVTISPDPPSDDVPAPSHR